MPGSAPIVLGFGSLVGGNVCAGDLATPFLESLVAANWTFIWYEKQISVLSSVPSLGDGGRDGVRRAAGPCSVRTFVPQLRRMSGTVRRGSACYSTLESWSG
jgi:hypothetical protein